jgi:tRNA(Ile)-lysidine synthase
LRLAIGLSGGADSVALLRLLRERSGELGIVLHAAHLHHGLRGAEADGDRKFAAELAAVLGVAFHTRQVDAATEAAARSETIEEAARRLRYTWFRELMASGVVDAVATAHTLDDQAETVLGKFLRGAWTEGLSGIHPVVHYPEGRIVRPILGVTRSQIEGYLNALNQPWREDSSNSDPVYTRNRLRHGLLLDLERENPRIREHLGYMAELARDEEAWWQAEISRLAPQMLLSGRPVRGGGRAKSDDGVVALDVVRVAALPVPLQRRLLRYAAGTLQISLGFAATESLRELAVSGRSGQQLTLSGGLRVERTPREVRLSRGVGKDLPKAEKLAAELPVPGEVVAFGWRFRAESTNPGTRATVRNWRPGDRVTLRYSSGPRKIKEVLERLKIPGTDRAEWPVIEWQGQIVWMQGVELQPPPGAVFFAEKVE